MWKEALKGGLLYTQIVGGPKGRFIIHTHCGMRPYSVVYSIQIVEGGHKGRFMVHTNCGRRSYREVYGTYKLWKEVVKGGL